MDDRPNHKITLKVVSTYTHGISEDVAMTIAGDGSIEHYVESFQAFLVAAGFASDTASRLTIRD